MVRYISIQEKNRFKRHTWVVRAKCLLAVVIVLITFQFAFSQNATVDDYRALKSNPSLAKLNQDGKVYHTNGALWNAWDNLGNTGDISCSATIPAFTYPGGSVYYSLCRGGYWIVAKSNNENGLVNAAGEQATYLEGTTGEYVLTRGTIPGPVSEGWQNPGSDYNPEPWVSTTQWHTSAGIKVVAKRYSWSYPGITNNFFRIGSPTEFFDFNDFIIEEITLTYDGDLDGDGTPDANAVATLDQVVMGIKADHDVTWNVGPAGFLENFWDDDGVDYDEDTFSTFELDGDRVSTSEDDTGIDDPLREWRGVHVGQTWISSPDAQIYVSGSLMTFPGNTVSHYWWTGENDPQSPSKRFAFSSSVFNSADEALTSDFTFDPTLEGDLKKQNPAVTDMRYLQAYGPWVMNKGESVTVVTAIIAGSGLESAKNASRAAKQVFAWGMNPPKPPSAPKMWGDSLRVTSDLRVRIYWENANENAVDPDLGVADFAGYRVYRSQLSPENSSQEILQAEGDGLPSNISVSQSFAGDTAGPYTMIKQISKSELGTYSIGSNRYEYYDTNVVFGFNYWYYVAAYDEGDASMTDWQGTALPNGLPPLETYYTMNYPLNSLGTPSTPPKITVTPGPFSSDDFKSTNTVVAVPNPWRSDSPKPTILFTGLPKQATIKIFDMTGNLIQTLEHESTLVGTEEWDLISRTRNQIVTGVYYYRVEDHETGEVQTGKLIVIR